MIESQGNTLSSLDPEEFQAMMGEAGLEQQLRVPFGADVMMILPEDQTQPDHVCSVETGTGDNEDEYPPRFDPTTEGSIEDLG